jgi:hypothetical protein
MDGSQGDAHVAAPRTRSWWLSLLDGTRVWGSFDAMLGRYGLRRYRLTLFPPGIGTADRRLVRAWRGWPFGGAALALLAAMCLSGAVLTPTTTLVMCGGAYVVVGAALFVLSAAPRAEMRSMSVTLIDGCSDRRIEARYGEWEALVEMLTAADEKIGKGALSPVEYEAVWWSAYDRLKVARDL